MLSFTYAFPEDVRLRQVCLNLHWNQLNRHNSKSGRRFSLEQGADDPGNRFILFDFATKSNLYSIPNVNKALSCVNDPFILLKHLFGFKKITKVFKVLSLIMEEAGLAYLKMMTVQNTYLLSFFMIPPKQSESMMPWLDTRRNSKKDVRRTPNPYLVSPWGLKCTMETSFTKPIHFSDHTGNERFVGPKQQYMTEKRCTLFRIGKRLDKKIKKMEVLYTGPHSLFQDDVLYLRITAHAFPIHVLTNLRL